jgi:hypothetical protein
MEYLIDERAAGTLIAEAGRQDYNEDEEEEQE